MKFLPENRRWRRALWTILLVGLVLRITSACALQYLLDERWHREFLIEGDAAGYWELAKHLAAGETYSIYDPPRFALRMPGFPAVLAISIKLFGESLFAARLFLATVSSIAPALVYLLGRRLFHEKIGVIAAAFAAISPTHIVFSSVLLVEIIFGITLLMSLLSATKLMENLTSSSPSFVRASLSAVSTGFWIAMGIYQKPSWLLAVWCFAGALLVLAPTANRLKACALATICVLVTFLLLLPWGARNHAVTGHFKFTTFWAGASLYDGINPQATGDSDMTFFDEDGLTKTMSEFEVDQHYTRQSLDYARNHPLHVLQLAMQKSWRYWKPWPNAEQFSHPLAVAAVSVTYLPCLLFSILGVGTLFRKKSQLLTNSNIKTYNSTKQKIWAIVILAGPVFYFAGLHCFFVSSLRYRLPAEFPLFVLAALGIWSLIQRTQLRQSA